MILPYSLGPAVRIRVPTMRAPCTKVPGMLVSSLRHLTGCATGRFSQIYLPGSHCWSETCSARLAGIRLQSASTSVAVTVGEITSRLNSPLPFAFNHLPGIDPWQRRAGTTLPVTGIKTLPGLHGTATQETTTVRQHWLSMTSIPPIICHPHLTSADKLKRRSSNLSNVLRIMIRGRGIGERRCHTTPPTRLETEAIRKTPPPTEGKFRKLWRQYGYVAVGVHLTIYASVLAGLYVLFSRSKFAHEYLNSVQGKVRDWGFYNFIRNISFGMINLDHGSIDPKAGAFASAWVAAKFTEPLRLILTLALTPRVARALGRAPPKVRRKRGAM